MFVEVSLTVEDRKRVVKYKQNNEIQMSRAYAELIRAGLEAKEK